MYGPSAERPVSLTADAVSARGSVRRGSRDKSQSLLLLDLSGLLLRCCLLHRLFLLYTRLSGSGTFCAPLGTTTRHVTPFAKLDERVSRHSEDSNRDAPITPAESAHGTATKIVSVGKISHATHHTTAIQKPAQYGH